MAHPSPLVAAVTRELQKFPQLDARAVLAIAAHEGLSGRIGDGGHAFGPFQMNDAGGVLTGKLGGSPSQKNAWAWSPAGIDAALSGISKVAGGLHGAQAVGAIASKYERPANVGAEIQDALAHYGGPIQGGDTIGGGAAGTLSAGTGVAAAPGTDPRRAFAQQLLAAISPTGQLDDAGLKGAIAAKQAAVAAPPDMSGHDQGSPLGAAASSGGAGSGIAELLREGVGGPTHSTGPHIHAAFSNPQLELAAINYAEQHGLHVGENPYVGDQVDPVHAPHSYHTRDFSGTFNGRKLGQAIDVSGPQQDAFYEWLKARRG